MTSYSDIRKSCGSRKRFAVGGRVSKSKQGAKTVINIVTPPAAGGTPAAMSAPPAAPMGNSPSPAGPPVPPAAAAMALGQMQGKPGMPGAFACGGRVKRKVGGLVKHTAGAESGLGRLQATRAERKVPKKPSAKA